jgi:hypothetical protein
VQLMAPTGGSRQRSVVPAIEVEADGRRGGIEQSGKRPRFPCGWEVDGAIGDRPQLARHT